MKVEFNGSPLAVPLGEIAGIVPHVPKFPRTNNRQKHRKRTRQDIYIRELLKENAALRLIVEHLQHTKSEYKKKEKRYKDRLRSEGRCAYCPEKALIEPNSPSIIRCIACNEKHKARMRMLNHRQRRRITCVVCGGEYVVGPNAGMSKTCRPCAAKLWRRKKRAARMGMTAVRD